MCSRSVPSSERSLSHLFKKKNIVYIRQPPFSPDCFKILTTKFASSEFPGEVNKEVVKSIDQNSSAPLVFESRFESGNLALVARGGQNTYNLLMQTDINSQGHTQWFFFKVTGTVAKSTVKFNLFNFAKTGSLHNRGMKIAYYSKLLSREKGIGWSRGGSNITYTPNGIPRPRFGTYSTLSFEFTFPYTADTVYFAYSVPYTYSQLQQELDRICSDPSKSSYINRKTLCMSLGKNKCDHLTITNPGTIEQNRGKKAVVLSARTHPGETVGSWMMQGVLEFLVSEEASALRDKYIFKIIPMVNIDGVINGNYRCSLIGHDLNRCWKNPSKKRHPVIYHFKELIKEIASSYKIELIADLHGHSKRNNIFVYGCSEPGVPEATRLFPYVLSSISPLFSYTSCRFGAHPSKEKTLRVSLFKELKIPQVYTLEASFNGPDSGDHFSIEDLKNMGRDLCKTLNMFNNSVFPQINNTGPTLNTLKDQLISSREDLYMGEGDSSGSESNPSDDNLEHNDLDEIFPVTPPRVEKKKRKQLIHKRAKKMNDSTDETVNTLPAKKKISRERTYTNFHGKVVQDQITQTPIEFYPKIVKIRSEIARNTSKNTHQSNSSINIANNLAGVQSHKNEFQKKHPIFPHNLRSKANSDMIKPYVLSETRYPDMYSPKPKKTFILPRKKGNLSHKIGLGFYTSLDSPAVSLDITNRRFKYLKN